MESQRVLTTQKCIVGAHFVYQQDLEAFESELQRCSRRDSTVETLPDDQAELNNRVQRKDSDEQRDKDARARENDQAHNDLVLRFMEKTQKLSAYVGSFVVPTSEACRQDSTSEQILHKASSRQQYTPLETWVPERTCGKVLGSRDQLKLHLEGSYHEMNAATKKAKLEDNRQNIDSMSLFWCGFCRCKVPFISNTSDPQGDCFVHIGDHLMGSGDQPKRDRSEWLQMENTPTECKAIIGKRALSREGNVWKRKLKVASNALPPKKLRSRIV
ncbi:unnamed protein product [Clonostachys rosea f. rosea IK726]|uniref:Uncharacterized protein n=1 Tax=Clonostachys rosea f. rosea IK726 TaxID=1349383 RepID=A0ACA9UR85_BIOOC|nr:unnamed protein product [Clonostachys rosea f. rosea IK726]